MYVFVWASVCVCVRARDRQQKWVSELVHTIKYLWDGNFQMTKELPQLPQLTELPSFKPTYFKRRKQQTTRTTFQLIISNAIKQQQQ